MNIVTASFDTTVRQMTEISQWPKCLSKNDRNIYLSERNSLSWAAFPSSFAT